MRSLLLLLLLAVPAYSQDKVHVASSKATAIEPVFQEGELSLGQYQVFDFTKTASGAKPFGGKPFSVEVESRDSNQKPTSWRGKVESLENGALQVNDQAIIFAGDDSPEYMTLRVIVDNATVYRYNAHILKKKPTPQPSPYIPAITAAFALDKGTSEAAQVNATIFRDINNKLATFKTGSDVWAAIDAQYRLVTPLVQTRAAISKIIFDVTRPYYDITLGAAERAAFAKMLGGIQQALEQCSAAPPVPPTPVNPAPIAEPGFRVMIVYPAKGLGALPIPQSTMLTAQQLRDYLNNKCFKNGTAAEWRIWPDNTNATGESELWQKAFARNRTNAPWIIISNGTTGFEGQLPLDINETIKLMDKYAQ